MRGIVVPISSSGLRNPGFLHAATLNDSRQLIEVESILQFPSTETGFKSTRMAKGGSRPPLVPLVFASGVADSEEEQLFLSQSFSAPGWSFRRLGNDSDCCRSLVETDSLAVDAR